MLVIGKKYNRVSVNLVLILGVSLFAPGSVCFANTPIANSSELTKLEKDFQSLDKGSEAKNPEQYVYEKQAEDCLKAGKYAEAIDNCTKAININPEDLHAYRMRAIAYTHLNEVQKATDDQNKLISLQEQISAKNSRDEIAKCNQAIKNNPKNSKAYAQRAAAYMNVHEYQLALDDSTKAISLDPNNKYAYFTRMAVYTALQSKSKAVADQKEFEALDKADKLRLNTSAVTDYSKILEANPNDVNALSNRARANFELGRFREAKKDCDTLVRMGSNKAEAEQLRSRCEKELQRKSKKISQKERVRG